MELFNPAGRVVRLGPQLGRTGGEGCVYEVSSDQELVAKIFHKPADLDKRAKLIHMISLTTPGLTSFAAWPKSLLLDRHQSVLGFLMPKAIGVEIHEVFSRTQRSTAFPGKEWNFSVRVARNCSAAFDEIHNADGAIGDVNEGNLLVAQNGTVSLIDCDSYQMTANGRTWTCDVGVPIWTAPELQGKTFRGLRRTANTDLFSLALLIFKILFMGRHPFAGVPLTATETTLEQCIKEFRFAFTGNSQALHIKPPPGAFPFERLPQTFRETFDRAFLRGSERPDARPSAKEWVKTLDSFESSLQRCKLTTSHLFPREFVSCPWCKLTVQTGIRFFLSGATTTVRNFRFDASLWPSIESFTMLEFVSAQYLTPAPISCSAGPLPEPIVRERIEFKVGIILLFLSMAVGISVSWLLGIGFLLIAGGLMIRGRVFSTYLPIAHERQNRMNEAKKLLESAFSKLRDTESDYQSAFLKTKEELKTKHNELQNLDNSRKDQIRILEASKRQLLLNAYLDNFLLKNATIPGIGPKRLSSLLSYGIETALDVGKSHSVPGIGEAFYAKLLQWRRGCEQRFKFDPAQAIPVAEIDRINLTFSQSLFGLEAQLKTGLERLYRLNQIYAANVQSIESEIKSLLILLSQARADFEAIPKE
jgi:DNA-binding helix-hairpin-helix protein with protein kinase domain